MKILDENHYLAEQRIPLQALNERLDSLTPTPDDQLLAEIKFTHLFLAGQARADQFNKLTQEFKQLQQLGVLGYEALQEPSLLHEIKGQFSKMLGLRMPDHQRYFLHLMSADKTVNQTLNFLAQNPELGISTLTGICMFGSGVDHAYTYQGNQLSLTQVGGLLPEIPEERIETIRICPHLSLYEAYKIKHFTQFLNSFIPSCRRRFGGANLMTPAQQYPIYLIPAYLEGMVSKAILQDWRQHSLQRSAFLYQRFARHLDYPLELLASPLEPIISYLNQEIDHLRLPKLETCLERLGNTDEYWAGLLSTAETRPTSWRELTLISYVRGVITAALQADSQGNVMIMVDDISEKPMANAYTKFRKRFRRNGMELPRILGLYAPQTVIASNPDHNSYLYGHTQPSRAEFRSIIKTYRKS